jgi:adenylate cyclase
MPQAGEGRVRAGAAPALAVPDRATLLRSLREFPGWVPNYRFLRRLLCSDRPARRSARDRAKGAALTPLLAPSATHWRNPEQRELYLGGLRLAAGEVV